MDDLTGSLGEWLPDATNPGADPTEYGNPLRYITHGPYTNWAVKAELDAKDAHRAEAGDKANTNGLYWTVGLLGD